MQKKLASQVFTDFSSGCRGMKVVQVPAALKSLGLDVPDLLEQAFHGRNQHTVIDCEHWLVVVKRFVAKERGTQNQKDEALAMEALQGQGGHGIGNGIDIDSSIEEKSSMYSQSHHSHSHSPSPSPSVFRNIQQQNQQKQQQQGNVAAAKYSYSEEGAFLINNQRPSNQRFPPPNGNGSAMSIADQFLQGRVGKELLQVRTYVCLCLPYRLRCGCGTRI